MHSVYSKVLFFSVLGREIDSALIKYVKGSIIVSQISYPITLPYLAQVSDFERTMIVYHNGLYHMGLG